MEEKIKKGDYVWVNSLSSNWLAVARTDPFVDGVHILHSPTEVILVKTLKGELWNAPTHLCKKLNNLDENLKKEAR